MLFIFYHLSQFGILLGKMYFFFLNFIEFRVNLHLNLNRASEVRWINILIFQYVKKIHTHTHKNLSPIVLSLLFHLLLLLTSDTLLIFFTNINNAILMYHSIHIAIRKYRGIFLSKVTTDTIKTLFTE